MRHLRYLADLLFVAFAVGLFLTALSTVGLFVSAIFDIELPLFLLPALGGGTIVLAFFVWASFSALVWLFRNPSKG